MLMEERTSSSRAAPALLAALASSSAFDNLASVASARETSRCACMSARGRASHAAKASAGFSAAAELPAANSGLWSGSQVVLQRARGSRRVSTQRVKNGGRGDSGRRGDRPTTCTVPEASQERVRYASAPGCPGRRRASLALTDLHTHTRHRRSAGTLKCTLLYQFDALPTRVPGDLRGIPI